MIMFGENDGTVFWHQGGILADRLHRARDQATAIASLVSSLSGATRLRDGLSTTLVTIARQMTAPYVTAVVKETHTGRVTLWHATSHAGRIAMSHAEVPLDRFAEWVAPSTPDDVLLLQRQGARKRSTPIPPAMRGLAESHRFRLRRLPHLALRRTVRDPRAARARRLRDLTTRPARVGSDESEMRR